MERGDKVYYIDCTKSGDVWDMTLPHKIYAGHIAGIGNELISVRSPAGYLNFRLGTKITREGVFKLVDFDEGQQIIANRKERFEAAYGKGARVVHRSYRR